jgi:uncharacterized membrane-anchored protein
MKRAKLLLGALIAFMAVQLVAVLWQAAKYEGIIYFGKTVYLAVEPLDPYDMFRGRYVQLSFADDYVGWHDDISVGGELIVRFLKTDEGISKPYAFTDYELDADEPYLKIKNYYRNYDDSLHISYPFNRFYMQEDLAMAVDANSDIFNNNAVAVVKILDGVGVLADVMIDNVSINEYIKKLQE